METQEEITIKKEAVHAYYRDMNQSSVNKSNGLLPTEIAEQKIKGSRILCSLNAWEHKPIAEAIGKLTKQEQDLFILFFGSIPSFSKVIKAPANHFVKVYELVDDIVLFHEKKIEQTISYLNSGDRTEAAGEVKRLEKVLKKTPPKRRKQVQELLKEAEAEYKKAREQAFKKHDKLFKKYKMLFKMCLYNVINNYSCLPSSPISRANMIKKAGFERVNQPSKAIEQYYKILEAIPNNMLIKLNYNVPLIKKAS